jgi:5'-nucleotidase
MVDYVPASQIAHYLVNQVLQDGLPAGILLNVNVPRGMIRGLRITRQGLRVYRDRLDRRMDPRGKPYYWIAGEAPTGVPEDGTDIGAMEDGYVSVTPLQLDLTAYPAIQALKKWSMDTRMPDRAAVKIRSNGRP